LNNTDEIEFSRVRKLVAGYAVSPEAKEKILAQPLANKSVKANALLSRATTTDADSSTRPRHIII